MVYLGLRKGRVARTRDGGIGRDLEHLAQGVRADELALTIEVRADDDGVSLLGQVLEGTDDALLGGELLDGGPDQVGKTWDLPALDVDAVGEKGLALAVIGGLCQGVGYGGREQLAILAHGKPALGLAVAQLAREIRCHDVSTKPYGDPLFPIVREAVDGRVIDLLGLGLANAREKPGDLLCGVILLCDNELQGSRSLRASWSGGHGMRSHPWVGDYSRLRRACGPRPPLVAS